MALDEGRVREERTKIKDMTDEQLDAEYPKAGPERAEAIEKESLRRHFAPGLKAANERLAAIREQRMAVEQQRRGKK